MVGASARGRGRGSTAARRDGVCGSKGEVGVATVGLDGAHQGEARSGNGGERCDTEEARWVAAALVLIGRRLGLGMLRPSSAFAPT